MIMKTYRTLWLLLLCGCATNTPAPTQSKSSFSIPYETHERGCMIIAHPDQQTSWINDNATQCKQPRSPCSTFKLPHAMIALEHGVLQPNERVPWDGVKRMFDAWNQPQTLRTALRYSTVWFFQRLARLIGEETMTLALRKMAYGNWDTRGGIDRFWLGSSLRVHVAHQLQFLKHAHALKVPGIDAKHVQTVWQALDVVSPSTNLTLQGKTGSCVLKDDDNHGWFVGRVTHQKQTYVFAHLLISSKPGLHGRRARSLAIQSIKQWSKKN